MTIDDFLLARIADLEELLEWPDVRIELTADHGGSESYPYRDHLRAEVEAYRRILGLHDEGLTRELARRDQSAMGAALMHADVLRALASAWADHPDFNPAWRA